MSFASNENMQKAMQRNIVSKDNIHAVVERARAFEQTFGEMPKIDISEGSAPAHSQIESLYFQREHGMSIEIDVEAKLLTLHNTVSNTLVTLALVDEYGLIDVRDGDDTLSVDFEGLRIDESQCEEGFEHLIERMKRIAIVNYNGESIKNILPDLRAANPRAIWIERSDLSQSSLVNQIIGRGNDREMFMEEFHRLTGPVVMEHGYSSDLTGP